MNTTNPVKPYLEFCACAVMVTMHASLRDGNWSFIVGDSQLKRFKHLEFVVQEELPCLGLTMLLYVVFVVISLKR